MLLDWALNKFDNQNHLKLTKHHSTDPLWDSTLLEYLGLLELSHRSLSMGWEYYVSLGLRCQYIPLICQNFISFI